MLQQEVQRIRYTFLYWLRFIFLILFSETELFKSEEAIVSLKHFDKKYDQIEKKLKISEEKLQTSYDDVSVYFN